MPLVSRLKNMAKATKSQAFRRKLREGAKSHGVDVLEGAGRVREFASRQAKRKEENQKQAEFSLEELQALGSELSDQVAVRGEEAARAVVPPGPLQRKVQQVAAGSPDQKKSALKRAVRNAAVAGGTGAATGAMARGVPGALEGATMAVPGAVQGYHSGARDQQQREITALLEDAAQRVDTTVQ